MSFPAALRLGLLAPAILSSGLAFAHDHALSRGRLVFGDHAKPQIQVLDLDSGEVTHRFDIPKPNPGLVTLAGGRFVAVKAGGEVRFLDTGLSFESHGDHTDIEKGQVALLPLVLTGQNPAHIVSGHGQAAVFFDGIRPWDGPSTAKATLLSLEGLAKPKPPLIDWPSPGPQHGLAVPLAGGRLLVSSPNPAYVKGDDRSASSRPGGFSVVRRTKQGWQQLARLDAQSKPPAGCPLFHGHAARGELHVFACEAGEGGGLLLLDSKAGQLRSRKLAYPDARRSSSLKARPAGRFVVGNYGDSAPYTALLRIDPLAQRLSAQDVMPVPKGQAVCQFDLSENGRRLANLTPDGMLRIYDLAPDWKEVAAFEAVAPFDCAYGAKTPTPSLVVIGQSAFVSDPVQGRIRDYGLETLKQGLDLPVGGAPTVLAGGDGG
ncbi:hypothetical protein ASG72_09805 [Bosea sp. Leaf344]|uniref:hypothetical protein n=1 Tax=Bosea sp. Leaf344 TaxID=1736346 RepID=UPI0006FDECF4|nr:hypothetical protein [Bosea sp. Leaf344]KQU51792.1 hypothetical protein ASG72_09805 [Bosea sp. Leaf344]